MKSLIVCADDYAQSPAIDAGIIQLIQQNRISAASCMVLSPRWAEAAKSLTPEIRSKADIGLHLDFTQFGNTYAHPVLIARSLLRSLPTKAIRLNIHAQLDRFEDALGTAPDYMDGHQHVHQLPQIRDALLDILKQRYSNKLPWIRIAKPPANNGFKGKIIKLLGANTLERKAKTMGFNCSGNLLGVYNFAGDSKDYEKLLATWISAADSSIDTPALMCHPAIEKPESEMNDPIYAARMNEFLALNSNNFYSLLQTVKLTRKPH
ncbi:MAG: ChbG/HpnK family deacetylase [Methylotenera sp.]|nr:ChbG/HpnK family deacetylase [Methylotenera sp.]MDO9388329.1 ChbG/HpnK family deacetylase [Methylotenera sp.]MDP2101667.1 ChbG/HpnK family deacetylase [Methylotenera sp.]MDP2280853.1 ChbG/HpnK family deacetylase [Methylotenera sp.]MDP3060924.1 ChbG/HpnK family deacetylase [Methylotenera sp.]